MLEEEEWYRWDQRYQEAAGDLEDRDAKLAELYTEAELGLELVGVTAIEDKLQDGVPESIHTLLQAGIKVDSLPREMLIIKNVEMIQEVEITTSNYDKQEDLITKFTPFNSWGSIPPFYKIGHLAL